MTDAQKLMRTVHLENGLWTDKDGDHVRLMRHNPITNAPDLSNLDDVEWIEKVSSRFGLRESAVLICEDCGQPLEDREAKNWAIADSRDIEGDGKPRCGTCYRDYIFNL